MKNKYTKENIESAVRNSLTITETLKKLNLKRGSFEHLKKYISHYQIDISHFNPNKERAIKIAERHGFKKISLENILIEKSSYNRNHLKNRLYKEKLKNRECELCGQGEIWMGKKISLILDHINGINDDNRIGNLRIVCPNCNATLDTHCGKNIKRKNKSKLTRLEISLKKRKFQRPTFNKLKDDIKLLGYVGSGRKYGVSDNTIRKWEIFYKKEDIVICKKKF